MALVTMVDDLFELAQVEAAEFARDARSVPLAEAVQGALDLCRPEAAEKRIRLEVDLGDAGQSPCSPKLARVVHSLLDYAVRFTQAGGVVSLGAGLDADLGLTLAKRIVEALGGRIEASSGPERGSRFDVSVPTRA